MITLGFISNCVGCLKLQSDKFESYVCKEKRVLGISMINLDISKNYE